MLTINMKNHASVPRSDSPRLCDSCVSSHIMLADNNVEKILCSHGMEGVIPVDMKVVKCSRYRSRNEMSLYDMTEMATIIVLKKGGGIGFVSSKEWNEKNPNENMLPPIPRLTT